MDDISPIIREIARGSKGAKDLSYEDAKILFGKVLDHQIDELQLGALLIGLRVKTESDDELLGFKHALDERTPQIVLPKDSPKLVVIPSYNGTRRQPNLVPLLASRLAQNGIPVLIHGRYDFESRINPLKQMMALDILTAENANHASELLSTQKIAFIHLKNLVPSLDQLLALRLRLGLRNSGHSVVKLLDPMINHSVRLVAVTHLEYIIKMRNLLLKDSGNALLMRGTEGEAYANPRRRPQLEMIINRKSEIGYPAEEGGTPPLENYPDTPENAINDQFLKDILEGKIITPQPILDQIDVITRLSRD